MKSSQVLPGDTIKLTWISSGTIVSSMSFTVIDGSEAIVSSASNMTDSGGGHWYADYIVPNSIGFYVAHSTAVINGKPYKRATRFQVALYEVD